MSVEQLLAYIAPFIVWAVTGIVKWALPKLQGWMIVSLVVPVLSAILALVMNAIGGTDLSWLQQFLYGFLAVFLNELIKQFTPKPA